MAETPIKVTVGQYFTLPDGHQYHYLDEGQGDPVVMVHGNPSWSFYYRNLVAALKDSHRCIVPDHIGCGFSDKPTDADYTYTLSRRIEDLTALLEHLNLRNITLVVHDWGGAIGMGFATRYPERIKQLVVLNTAAFHLPASKGRIPAALRLGRDTALGAWLIEKHNAFSIGASWVGCKQHPMSRALRAAYQLPYGPGQRRATLRFVQDIPLHPDDPAYAVLSEIDRGLAALKDKPMLILWGMKDFVFDRHFLEQWLLRFPEAEVYRFPAAGHYVLEDVAADAVPLIQDFVQGHNT